MPSRAWPSFITILRRRKFRAATALLDGLTRFKSSLFNRGDAWNRRPARSEARPLSSASVKHSGGQSFAYQRASSKCLIQLAFDEPSQSRYPRLDLPASYAVSLEFRRLVPYLLDGQQFPDQRREIPKSPEGRR